MNKNASIAVVIIALVVIGTVIYFSTKKPVVVSNTTLSQTETQSTTNIVTTANKSGLPIVITNSVSFPTDTTVILNGTINPNGAVTSYWYEYGTSKGLGDKTTSGMIGSGYTTIGAPGYIASLSKDKIYYYRLVAENKYGRVAGIDYSFKTTNIVTPVIGSAPSVRTSSISGISRTGATLKGEVDPNKAQTHYWFEYGTTLDLGNTTEVISAGDGDLTTSVSNSISDLEPLMKYYMRLNAQNQFGTVNGSTISFRTEGPANPSLPAVSTKSANDVSSLGAQLNATVDPNGDTTSYWFEYSDDSLLGGILVATEKKSVSKDRGVTSVGTDINDLTENKNYYFSVVAQNSVGISRGDVLFFKTKQR